jgi:hypothetical protein
VTQKICVEVFLRIMRRLLVTANVIPGSPILVTLIMVALSSSETLVLTRTTRRNIPEDAILHSRRRENCKSYILVMLLETLWIDVSFQVIKCNVTIFLHMTYAVEILYLRRTYYLHHTSINIYFMLEWHLYLWNKFDSMHMQDDYKLNFQLVLSVYNESLRSILG